MYVNNFLHIILILLTQYKTSTNIKRHLVEFYHIRGHTSKYSSRVCLNKWQAEKSADEYYRFYNIQNKDLADILNAFEAEITKKLYRIGDLKHIKQTIKFSE